MARTKDTYRLAKVYFRKQSGTKTAIPNVEVFVEDDNPLQLRIYFELTDEVMTVDLTKGAF